MLTRLYIDNFRCFVDFEFKPGRRNLILGRNGTGKTSLLGALFMLRQFAISGSPVAELFGLNQRTRWLKGRPAQTYQIDASIGGGSYVYRLQVAPEGDPEKPIVLSEALHFDGKPLMEFSAGEVQLRNDRFDAGARYPFDWGRSALATINPRADNALLARFKEWLGSLYCFRPNPFGMDLRAEKEDLAPNVYLSNIAAWYRHLLQTHPGENALLIQSLRDSIDGFSFLKFVSAGENVSLLLAEFCETGGSQINVGFGELSDGQRCLICLYIILHFVLAKGGTVIIDEPENFISLREIQPWLMAAAETVEESQGQLLLISHHPELIDQWAPSCGVQFVRDGIGAVRVEDFRGDPESALSPAELVARGWERG